jgi:hypothetical protein
LTIRSIRRNVRDVDALQGLRHAGDDYAGRPIDAAFNWQEAGADLGDGEWYLVAFRSIRKPTADDARLEAYDEAAHQEAAAAPGFVHYYKGPKATDGSCLSFCLWSSRVDARAAAGKPLHVSAVSLVEEMYVAYTLEFHRVTRTAGGPLTFEPYDGPPHQTRRPGETADPGPPTESSLVPQPAFRPAPAS